MPTTEFAKGGPAAPPVRLVFLGTPEVVVPVVEALRLAPDICHVVSVVTAPPARRGRGAVSEDMPSAVQAWAQGHGLKCHMPVTARDETFLATLESEQPDLCVTAAYGQFLPPRFLRLPRFGTLNIHPSLLPEFRGAAPVQRALEAGLSQTGVTLLFSTAKMDAGPIVAQKESSIAPDEDSPKLLARLFAVGASLLLQSIDQLRCHGLEGLTLRQQDDSVATHAPKLAAHEAFVDPRTTDATTFANRVRAFVPWPGVKLRLKRGSAVAEAKIVSAEALLTPSGRPPGAVWFADDACYLSCKDGASVLRVSQLQLAGKRVMTAADVQRGWPPGHPPELAE